MAEMTEREYLRWFTALHLDNELLSTGASKVEFSGILYNVTNSSKDPKKIPGYNSNSSWTTIFYGETGLENEECYVTNQKPPEGKGNHPAFEAGGHMTTTKSGVVETGGITYIMPLCAWHNNPARNGKPFEHTKTTMVKLTGFMEGDTPLTFMMRLPSTEKYSVLFIDPETNKLDIKNMPDNEVLNQNLREKITSDKKPDVENFVLFERDNSESGMYRVKEAVLQ